MRLYIVFWAHSPRERQQVSWEGEEKEKLTAHDSGGESLFFIISRSDDEPKEGKYEEGGKFQACEKGDPAGAGVIYTQLRAIG